MIDYPVGHTTIVVPIHTTAADGSPLNPSDAFEVGDFKLYKDGGTTERTSTAGWTIRSPHDSLDGLHALIIDASENTHAGFYAAGHTYQVALDPDETVDGIAVRRWVGQFSIDLHGIAAALSTLNGKLDAIDDYVDTEIAAIKNKTDNLPDDPADQSILAGAIAAAQAILDRLDAMIEDASGYDRWLASALEEAPGVGGSGAAWVVGTDLDGWSFAMMKAASPGEPAPGLTVTAERLTSGGAWEPTAEQPTAAAGGAYRIDLKAADSEASGTRITTLRFTAPTAITRILTLILAEAA
jgi:hypothetical protein